MSQPTLKLNQPAKTNDMKPTIILMCAVAAGAMAFVSHQAQAAVIDNNLYVPLNFKATVSYVKNNKITKATITSKTILNYYDYAKGAQLAVGPGNQVFAISKTAVLGNLTTAGEFYFIPDDKIQAGTEYANGYNYTDAGTLTVDFYSNGDSDFPEDNDYALLLNGNFTYTVSVSTGKSGSYNQSSKFGFSNLGGSGYDSDVSDVELPMSGSGAGSASGKLQVVP